MRGENQAGPLFTIVNCVEAWMIALELDHFVFTSLYSNDYISGCSYSLYSLYSEFIHREDDVDFYSYIFDLAYFKNKNKLIHPVKLF